jgi:hypothetical protein
MKISVKSVEKVEVMTLVEKDIVKDIKIPDVITYHHPHFQDTIDYLKTLEFVATSCDHNDFDSFASYDQGGSNSMGLIYIRLIHDFYGKLTYEVRWVDYEKESDGAIVIFNTPKRG